MPSEGAQMALLYSGRWSSRETLSSTQGIRFLRALPWNERSGWGHNTRPEHVTSGTGTQRSCPCSGPSFRIRGWLFPSNLGELVLFPPCSIRWPRMNRGCSLLPVRRDHDTGVSLYWDVGVHFAFRAWLRGAVAVPHSRTRCTSAWLLSLCCFLLTSHATRRRFRRW